MDILAQFSKEVNFPADGREISVQDINKDIHDRLMDSVPSELLKNLGHNGWKQPP